MHITVNITHPAHFHFFKNAIRLWQAEGHRVSILAREKDLTVPLLEEAGLAFKVLTQVGHGMRGLALELVQHSNGVWQHIQREKPDILVAIAGTFIVYPAKLANIPALVFYDTEHAKLSNRLSYPMASRIFVPRAYQGELSSKFERYQGYQELAYLHPNHFKADADKLAVEGLELDEPFSFVRLVAWNSHHDVYDYGVSNPHELVARLEKYGRVLISSEADLPPDLQGYQMRGRPNDVHHILAHARLLFGESATMASEAAQLGVPSIFLSSSRRGYTDELEARYGLVYNFNGEQARQDLALNKAESILASDPRTLYQERYATMIAEQIDVTAFIMQQVEKYGKNRG